MILNTVEDLIVLRKEQNDCLLDSDTNMMDAVTKMTLANVSAAIVVDQDLKIKGILSERDVFRHIAKQPKYPQTHDNPPITTIMTKKVITVTLSSSIAHAHRLMRQHYIRHLAVIGGVGGFLTMITISEVANAQAIALTQADPQESNHWYMEEVIQRSIDNTPYNHG